jgi:hypothetical protein
VNKPPLIVTESFRVPSGVLGTTIHHLVSFLCFEVAQGPEHIVQVIFTQPDGPYRFAGILDANTTYASFSGPRGRILQSAASGSSSITAPGVSIWVVRVRIVEASAKLLSQDAGLTLTPIPGEADHISRAEVDDERAPDEGFSRLARCEALWDF